MKELFTMYDLLMVKKHYKDNMKKMKATIGTPEQDKYVDEERRLNFLEIRVAKQLGMFVCDPCPIGADHYCRDCTGYFARSVRQPDKTHRKYNSVKRRTRGRKCEYNNPRAEKCVFKTIYREEPIYVMPDVRLYGNRIA